MDISVNVKMIEDKIIKHIKLNDCLIKRLSTSIDSRYIECKHINVKKVIKIRISNHKNYVPYDIKRYTLIDINPYMLNIEHAKIAINDLIKD